MALSSLVTGLAHIGIRVNDLERARNFYTRLGFNHAWGPSGPEHVTGMTHGSGLEINLIVNAASAGENILMDVAEKHSGFTHIALKVKDLAAVEKALTESGIEISGRRGKAAVFVRDPDRNVIELASD